MKNILNLIWILLTSTNENLINVFSIPLFFVENFLAMLLFTTILNISTTKKQRILYVLASSIISIMSKFIIPSPFNTIINIVGLPITIFFIFKTSVLKSILSEFMPMLICAILETALLKLFYLFFCIQPFEASSIPIYRFAFMFIDYSCLFVFYMICKKCNFNITILDNMNSKTKKLFILNSVLMILAFILQIVLVSFYIDNLPISITLISMITLIGYYIISIYSLTRATKLEITSRDLEESQQYNKTLSILHDNMRCFKHDFNNIITTIGGYVYSEDLVGLKNYYSQLIKDCQKNNNLAVLNPNTINNPAIYSLLTNKYHNASELEITVNVDCFIDFNTLNMEIYEFTRIFRNING